MKTETSSEMRCLPVPQKDGTLVIFILMGDRNIERMKQHDPPEFEVSKLCEPYCSMKVKSVVWMYATTDEIEKLDSLTTKSEVKEFLVHLSRGWEYKPHEGDNDKPYDVKHIVN